MKLALLLVVVLPLAFAAPAPEKRFLIEDFSKIFNVVELKNIIQDIVNKAGTDASETACENECRTVITATILEDTCPVICKSFQALIGHFQIAKTSSATL
ncbi:hypothetical protein SNE40_022878 [Patella caerulea]|uniref:Uncharacterized protein n=1 Tax=Patella caerulea TaxID=87958 RepID=A0AAN8IWB4_PATCE